MILTKARLIVDFDDRDHLKKFVARLKLHGLVPPNSKPYRSTLADYRKFGGVTPANAYILRTTNKRDTEALDI